MESNVYLESIYNLESIHNLSAFNVIDLLKFYFQRSIAIIIFLLMWEIAPRIGLVNISFISSPSVIFASMVDLTLSGELITQTASNLVRVFPGFRLAFLVALPLGFLLGDGFSASLPSVFTGIRTGTGFSFFMLIGSEMIGVHSGLGFMIIQAQDTFQIPKMYAGIVTVALLGIVINYVMLELEKRLAKRKESIVI